MNKINVISIIKLIENDDLNFQEENILHKINNILKNIPSNLTPLEKVRFVYLKLGDIFYFDYRTRYSEDIYNSINKQIDYNTYINNYVSCIPMSTSLNNMLNQIDDVKSQIIYKEIKEMRGKNYQQTHVANEVKIKDKTYLIDLALDLYLIKSHCRTKYFGKEKGNNNQYDILNDIELENIDKKIGFNTDYIDNIFPILKNNLLKHNYSPYYINYLLIMINSLLTKYNSHHEAKKFVNLLLDELLDGTYHEYNIYKMNNDKEIVNFKTVYKIKHLNKDYWIIFSHNIKAILIDEEILDYLLNNGFCSKSESLIKYNVKKYNKHKT